MPKIVDHENQKERIAEVVWNIIHKEGLEQCTVRKIAKEAGISAGSMRHYFPNQAKLFIYSMQLVVNRVKTRIDQLTFTETPEENAKQLLLQLLPIDAERKLEMEAWFSFTAKSISDPELKQLRKEMNEGIFSACQMAVEALCPSQNEMERKRETEHLYALLDGLALHAILKPDRVTHEMIDSVLTNHLQTLSDQK
ncbi:TetR/AcrR family transcriptional regulator [Bacillus sp. CLL-7-23]|uniref:TetR/AcrR family transcriptional regulator n=1 Tax=Bacillus changyiensis TaxID=3004103 RepID=A0ABT4X5Q5_9BACI|nr:TetR/AcrR family transcriptional regulator [Bacillus changyiensis]MDA7027533.1 TetR/AcrR family transcriptional regulator [Bacillus changyiensis]